MPSKKKITADKVVSDRDAPLNEQVQNIIASLKSKSTQHDRDNLKKFGISTSKFFGVSMANLKVLAKQLGKYHLLAIALWETGWYEARMLATLIDDQELVTPSQMDKWCKDFDNWGICDTACFCLFDRTPHAFKKVTQWSRNRDEFVKRAAFALLACLALHDKNADDEQFAEKIDLIEKSATDDRNFVKKGISWALRSIGIRSPALYSLAIAMAQKLSRSESPSARWIGKDTIRELNKPASIKNASILKSEIRGDKQKKPRQFAGAFVFCRDD